MQSIYAMHQSHVDNIDKQENFLLKSIEGIQDLYLVLISILIEIKKYEEDFLEKSSKKYLATQEEKQPNYKFINNKVINILENNKNLYEALQSRYINNWVLDYTYINLFLHEIKQSILYEMYMSTPENSFEEDKKFVLDVFTTIIAPNEKLYDYLENNKLTWVDDIPIVNTAIIKQISQIQELEKDYILVYKLYKEEEDKAFVKDLFRKTVLNEVELSKEYIDKTPNWDTERIAELDTIILKMAICEFLKFPLIPVKVTINEYLELAKEYSTPKSSLFINGVLDNIVKDFEKRDKLKKIGRGLI